MDSVPSLSIIVPAYNSESSLERCIDSVFKFETQEFIEVIIVDDCSTDKTKDICGQLSLLYPGVCVHRNTENLGVAQSRNKGITLARGKYIGFLDSDDYYESGQSDRKTLASLFECEYDLVFLRTQNMARSDRLYSNLFDVDRSTNKSTSLVQRIHETETDVDECNGCFVRRDFLIHNDIFFPSMSVGEDTVFMVNLILKTKSFSYFDQLQYVHSARAGGLATTFNARNLDSYFDGVSILRDLHTRQSDDEKSFFLEQVLKNLFRSLWCYLLMFHQGKGITYDDERNSNLEWITKRIFPHFESLAPPPVSYQSLLVNFMNEIYDRVPEDLRNNKGINYIYCLSEYSAAASSVLIHKGMMFEAIIDDNRVGSESYEHIGLRVRSFDDVNRVAQQSTLAGAEKRFFVCHPSENVFQNIKARLLVSGILEKNIVWIRFFDFAVLEGPNTVGSNRRLRPREKRSTSGFAQL